MGCKQACLSHDHNEISKLDEIESVPKASPRPVQGYSNTNSKEPRPDISNFLRILISKFKLSENLPSLPPRPKKYSKKSRARKEKKNLTEIKEVAECPNENDIEPSSIFQKKCQASELDTEVIQISPDISLSQDLLQSLETKSKSTRAKDKKPKKFDLELNGVMNQSLEHISVASSATRSLLNNSIRSSRKLYTMDGKEINVNLTMTQFNGEAKYKWPDNSVYEGQWKNNKMHGQGILCWPDGRVYKGSFINGMREGFGIMSWANGQVYEGSWKAGKQDGRGVLTIKGKSSPIVIKGNWVNGMRGEAV